MLYFLRSLENAGSVGKKYDEDSMTTPWLGSLDIGQVSDPTALAITATKRVRWSTHESEEYQVRHLERFPLGMPYPEIAMQVGKRLQALPLQPGQTLQPGELPYTLVLDATGVGLPIADMFDVLSAWPIKVILTGGYTVSRPARNVFHAPKRFVIGALQVVIQARRLRVAADLPDAETLVKEALNYEFKLSGKSGEDTYGAWRSGTHDDLLLAVAIGVWHHELMYPVRVLSGPDDGAQKATGTGNPLTRHRAKARRAPAVMRG